MKTLWFKRKSYGWGWVPVTWQGWSTVVVFIIFQFWNFFRLDSSSHSVSDTVRPFLIETGLANVVLFSVCLHTGESPRWQWGEKKTREN